MAEKYLLRRALADLLPTDIVRRTQATLSRPRQRELLRRRQGPGLHRRSAQRQTPAHKTGYFDPAMFGRLVDKYRAGKATGFADNQALVGILSTRLLNEQFVRG